MRRNQRCHYVAAARVRTDRCVVGVSLSAADGERNSYNAASSRAVWRSIRRKRFSMIVYELFCTHQHRFEAWFASMEDYEKQRTGGLLSCPICGDPGVEKLPSARIGGFATPEKQPAVADTPASTPSGLVQLIETIIANTDDVGQQFAEEARRIHYQEAPQRAIRGIATVHETRELLEEGIAVLPLPLRREDLN